MADKTEPQRCDPKGRQDIVLAHDRFQVLFSSLDANPVHPRRPH